MSGHTIDWAIIVQHINDLLDTHYTSENEADALRALVKHHGGNVTHAAGAIGISKSTMTRKGVTFSIPHSVKANNFPIEPIDVFFDEEAWIASNKKRSPCYYCSGGFTADKRNPTCRACKHREVYARSQSGLPSYLGRDSFGDLVEVCTIGAIYCGHQ